MKLTDLLGQLGIEFKLAGEHEHVRQGWVGLDCPSCSPGWRHWRLGVHEDSFATNCWVCGRQNTVEVLAALSGQPYGAVRGLLKGLQRHAKPPERARGHYKPPWGVQGLLEAHRKYLNRRSFDPGEIEKVWGVGGIGLAPRLAWRLFIPIFDCDGRPVSWTTRAISDDVETRYVTASVDEEAASRKTCLYGEHLAGQAAVVVEGPTDAWRIGPGAVATLGVAFSRAQVLRLSRFAQRVVVFDSEPEAQRQAGRLCELLSVFPGNTICATLDADDPGSASDREINRLRRCFLRRRTMLSGL